MDPTILNAWKISLFRDGQIYTKILICSCHSSQDNWIKREPLPKDLDEDSVRVPKRANRHHQCIKSYEGLVENLFSKWQSEFWPKDQDECHLRLLIRPRIRMGMREKENSVDAGRRVDFALIEYPDQDNDDDDDIFTDSDKDESYTVSLFSAGEKFLSIEGSQKSDMQYIYDI